MLKDKLEKAKPTQFFDDDVVEWWKEQRKLKMTKQNKIHKELCYMQMLEKVVKKYNQRVDTCKKHGHIKYFNQTV